MKECRSLLKYCFVFIFVFFGFIVKAQENYSMMARKALETMRKAKDESGYKKALEMYEEAFRIYPDSIDGTGLHKASVLASELKYYDKAFQYLIPLAAMKTYEDGYLGWSYIVGNYSESEYKNLLADPRWNALKIKAKKDKEQFFNELKEQEEEFYSREPNNNLNNIEDENTLYEKIKNLNPYKPKKKS